MDGQLTVFHCLYFSCGSHSSGVAGWDLDKEESRRLTSALARAAPILVATISVTKTGSEVDMEEKKFSDTCSCSGSHSRPVASTPVKLMGCDTDIEESRRLILAPALGYSL